MEDQHQDKSAESPSTTMLNPVDVSNFLLNPHQNGSSPSTEATNGAAMSEKNGGNGWHVESKTLLTEEEFLGKKNGKEIDSRFSCSSPTLATNGSSPSADATPKFVLDAYPNHFPGGQGSDEVAHRGDKTDGSILSKVGFFNALGGKREERPPPPKGIGKIVKVEKTHFRGFGDSLDANPPRHHSDVPMALIPQGFYSLQYYMKHPRRGMAVIINNRQFTMSNTPFRKGSDNDAVTLEKTLNELGFKVDSWRDLTAKEMREAMKFYSQMDHSDADCFFLAMFSHGEDGVIFGTDSKVSLTDLTMPFRGDRCTTLAGKPKIFVVQACRGDQLDGGVDLMDSVDADSGVYRLPVEADFLYAFSTPSGYFSWRNTELGSWFIQSLCRTLSEHAAHPDMDVLRLLTRVNYEVAMANESNVPNDTKWHRKKQIPSIVSMLTKDLFFTPKSSHK